MNELVLTSEFAVWLDGLRDDVARVAVLRRLDRLAKGNPGDVRPVGSSVSELRIDHGPGYRVYFVQAGAKLIVILGGGDKRTQRRDIAAAIAAAATL